MITKITKSQLPKSSSLWQWNKSSTDCQSLLHIEHYHISKT